MGYSTQSIGNWTDYTPSWTGFSADPSSVTARYTLSGKLCTVSIAMTAGTSNATTMTVTLPFAAKGVNVFLPLVANSGTYQTGRAQTAANSNILTCYSTPAAAAFTGSGNKGLYLGTFTYEIA